MEWRTDPRPTSPREACARQARRICASRFVLTRIGQPQYQIFAMLIKRTRSRRTRAAAAVELAASLPPLMAILMGVIESGRLMSASEIVVNATREGARYATLGGSTM